MSHSSKRMIAGIAAEILLIIAYLVYVFSGRAPAPDDIKSWAAAILIFIGAGVAVMIVIQILFRIALAIGISVKEKDCDGKKIDRIIKSSMLEDERDKLIDLKSSHIGHVFAGTGFIAALFSLAFGCTVVVALHILLAAFAAGALTGGCASVYHYEKGV